jgi:hypothetical protein
MFTIIYKKRKHVFLTSTNKQTHFNFFRNTLPSVEGIRYSFFCAYVRWSYNFVTPGIEESVSSLNDVNSLDDDFDRIYLESVLGYEGCSFVIRSLFVLSSHMMGWMTHVFFFSSFVLFYMFMVFSNLFLSLCSSSFLLIVLWILV